MAIPLNYLPVVSIFVLGVTNAYILGDRLLDKAYYVPGDLNIGGIFPVTTYSGNAICGVSLFRSALATMEIVEALAFAVEKINQEQILLPGIKLGFVFLDSCSNPQAGVLQAIRFLPQSNEREYQPTSVANYLHSYKVIGVIGTAVAQITTPVSILLSGAGIPLISFWDGHDDLSNKKVHRTFLRLIPPDVHHIKAILSFLNLNNWHLFSVVAQDDDFGRAALKILTKTAQEYQMCVSAELKVSENTNFEKTLKDLVSSMAKVVVSLMSETSVGLMIAAVKTLHAKGKLIWVVTDRWLEYLYYSDLLEGTFVISSSPLELKGFAEYFSMVDFNRNPWFNRALKEKMACQDEPCRRAQLKSKAGQLTSSTPDIYDTMMTYAYGLRNLIDDFCPNATGQVAVDCFYKNQKVFVDYLKAVNFTGESGQVLFDQKGDRLTFLNVYQVKVKNRTANATEIEVKRVAYYDILGRKVYSFGNQSLHRLRFHLNETLIRTRCKIPCKPDEYKNYVRKCCWICKKCQTNERVIDNDTACQKCPAFHWPALVNDKLSTCELIEVTVFDWFHPVTLALLITDALGLGLVFLVLVILWLSQSTSDEDETTVLVIIQLTAIVWGFMAVPIFLLRPTVFNCNTAHTLFLISFSVMYLAMFLRTVEVYRKCFKVIEDYELKFTSRNYLILFTVIMVSIKVMTYVTVSMYYPIRALSIQPTNSEKLVELVCDIPFPHTIAFLLFSMILLLICSIFSLKSQNDPYGFERNRFVSMFVVISLIMWIAFMPAYFTAVHHRMRTYFRILSILVNHNSALVLNFTPAFLLVCLRRRKDSGPGGFGYFRSSRQSGNAPTASPSHLAKANYPEKNKVSTVASAEQLRDPHKITFSLQNQIIKLAASSSQRDQGWDVDP